MESLKVFQLEKNNEDIRKTVIKNIVLMLTERGTLNRDKLENNIKKLIDKRPDDSIYIIDKDNHKEGEKAQIAIKLFTTKITSISKQSVITEFLSKYQKYHKIIVVKSINTKTYQYIVSKFPETELFLEEALMINLIDSALVPKYEVLDGETEEFKNFCETYQCKKRNIPKISVHDPISKYYNLKKGDIIRIIRPSETAGNSIYYRIVIN